MPDDARCDQPGHEAVVLDGDGRARLIDAVWGDRERRQRLVRARDRHRKAMATGGAIGGAIAGVASVLALPSRLFAAGATLAGATIGAAVADVIAGRAPDDAMPLVAADPGPAPPRARATIASAPDLTSPASDVWCAAWAIELWGMWRGKPRLMLRDAWTDGLDLALEGGGKARVPAGPWRPGGGLIVLVDTDERALSEHLRAIDARHDPDHELDPFRHDSVRESLLQVGDRVELCGAWRPEVIPGDARDEPLYRDAPATILVPDGWPVLRRIVS
jgi:hypothetical protein